MPKGDALDLTDRKLEEMERHLKKIYSRAEKEIGEAWKQYMVEADSKVADLTKAYIEAKKSGDKEAIREAGKRLAGAKQERTIYNNHYQALTRQTAESISHVNEIATRYINGQLPEIYSLNYNEVARRVNRQLGGRLGGYSFELTDAHTVRRLATQQENLLPYKTVNGKRDVRWNVAKINSEVTQGILQGESMPKIATRLSDVLGMDATAAIRNARTSVTSAQNKGRMDMMEEAREKGVIVKKGWSAALDDRTRGAHEELNGVYVDMDEPFKNSIGEIMYPGDPDADPANVYNCRCSLVYKVIGFERRG
jgi:SPP1 gp7 family putative phage head morphogenesis protein